MSAFAFQAGRTVTQVALRRLLGFAAAVILAGALILFLGLGIGPHTGRYRTMTVLSGSMRPAFAPGDVVVVTPEPVSKITVGQVVVYAIPIADHHIEAHRVTWLQHRRSGTLIRTKGDANKTADPWTARLNGNRVWRVRAVVPTLGRAIIKLQNPRLHLLLLYGAPLLLLASGLCRIWRRKPNVTQS